MKTAAWTQMMIWEMMTAKMITWEACTMTHMVTCTAFLMAIIKWTNPFQVCLTTTFLHVM